MENINRPANPVTDTSNLQQNGITKLEYAAIHIYAGILASGIVTGIPFEESIKHAIKVATELLNQTDKIKQP